MYIVLLSGGSGMRLWPLSNDLYSKQYIKLMNYEKKEEETGAAEEIDESDRIAAETADGSDRVTAEAAGGSDRVTAEAAGGSDREQERLKCSMLQRVYEQLKSAGLAENTIVCAGESQVELIESQLKGQVEVAVEPMRRDTFPAVMLSCAYLLSEKGAGPEDVAAFLPVDPYTAGTFFTHIRELGDLMEGKEETIGLLGAVPTYPSTKYGYIIPEQSQSDGRLHKTQNFQGQPQESETERLLKVQGFREKPQESEAEQLIQAGALWNCGVFCFSLSLARQWLKKYGVSTDYAQLAADYGKLPKKSFDYEVLEHWDSIAALKYEGMWKDLGTWNTLTEEMPENSIGDVTWDTACVNSHAINMLGIPLVVMGAKNMVIAASHDGILVADKHRSSYLKDCMGAVGGRSRYEERRWGISRTIDWEEYEDTQCITRRIQVWKGETMPLSRHRYHRESITVLSGSGTLLSGEDGTSFCGENGTPLLPGRVFQIPEGETWAVRAEEADLSLLVVSIYKKNGKNAENCRDEDGFLEEATL